jgi:hypothetical protein
MTLTTTVFVIACPDALPSMVHAHGHVTAAVLIAPTIMPGAVLGTSRAGVVVGADAEPGLFGTDPVDTCASAGVIKTGAAVRHARAAIA